MNSDWELTYSREFLESWNHPIPEPVREAVIALVRDEQFDPRGGKPGLEDGVRYQHVARGWCVTWIACCLCSDRSRVDLEHPCSCCRSSREYCVRGVYFRC